MAKNLATNGLDPETEWRKAKQKQRAAQNAWDVANGYHPHGSRGIAGAGLLARSLESMTACHYRGSRVRFEPPKPRDGAGKPVFGSHRGTSYRGAK